MSDKQQNEQYKQQYKAIEKRIANTILRDEEIEEVNTNKVNDNSVGTIYDQIINTINDNNQSSGKFLTVQVSTRLNENEIELDEDELYANIAGASTKFIIPWMNKKLITGILHNILNVVTDDICGFNSWVEDF